jgi:hypothetical protein
LDKRSSFGVWLAVAKCQVTLFRPFFFDAGAGGEAQGFGHEGPNFIREFLGIGSLFAHQGTD